MLVLYASKFVDDEDVAYDMVQDAFLNLWKNFSNLTNQKAAKSYLFTSVRNNCLNHLSRNSIRKKYTDETLKQKEREIEYYSTAYTSLLEKEMDEKLTKVIAELPEKYQLPFKMSRMDNLKNKEIAEKLGIPIRTVETRIYRALIQIKAQLKDYLVLFFIYKYQKRIVQK